MGPDLYTAALRRGRSLGHVAYVLQTHPHSDHLDQNTLFARAAGCQVEGTVVACLVCSRATITQLDRRLFVSQPQRLDALRAALDGVALGYTLHGTEIASAIGGNLADLSAPSQRLTVDADIALARAIGATVASTIAACCAIRRTPSR